MQVLFSQRLNTALGFLACLFARSGCPFDLEFREVRDSSLVLLWAAPLYGGRGPITGYVLEMSEGDQTEDWIAVQEKTISGTHYKVRKVLMKVAWFGWR